ncbi:MAG: hypothetical protein QXW65_02290 [Candidatus Pacearchaeota archaeon]
MDILKPFGKFDLLYFYTKIAPAVVDFLKNKEIASKIHVSSKIGFFIRRGSKDEPLFIEELCSKELNEEFFKIRAEMQREEAIKQNKLSKLQAKVWLYFPPDKCIDFFYACNKEGQGKQLDRIFIDVDRVNLSSESALEVTKKLIELIKQDKALNNLINYSIKVLWTGSSFHVYLMLKRSITLETYNKYFAYSKAEPLESFIGRWAEEISRSTEIKVIGGHEKQKNCIVLDPSQTPSGKLARAPFSLHFEKNPVKKEKSINGICVPLSEKMLEDKQLIKKLKALTPEKVLKEIDFWKKNL